MEIFYTRAGGFPDPLAPDRTVTRRGIERLGLVEGMPFVLRDDGAYDEELNRFFGTLPHDGCASSKTWSAYAGDVVSFARFLAQRPGSPTLWQATVEDTDAYHAARRLRKDADYLEKSSWNRAVAALERLYDWALDEGLVRAKPFRYRQRQLWGPAAAEAAGRGMPTVWMSNRAQKRGARRFDEDGERALALSEYRLWRNVGLRGTHADGRTPDDTYRRRTAERDAAMANLLITTGMRREEAGSLITPELPRAPRGDGPGAPAVVRMQLAPECAKGDKSRYVYIPRHTLLELRNYVDIDRADAVARRRGRNGGPHPTPYDTVLAVARPRDGRLEVVDADGGGVQARACQTFGLSERRRLVLLENAVPADPAALWLTEHGVPVAPAYWTKVFDNANARCAALGVPIRVTPHDLRHTYAVHLLPALIREMGKVVALHAARQKGTMTAYTALLTDPLQELRIRMGHARIETTYKYLRSLREPQEAADEAAHRMAQSVYGPISPDDLDDGLDGAPSAPGENDA